MLELAVIASLFVKTFVDNIKFLWEPGEFSRSRLASLIVSVVFTVLYGINALGYFGFDIPYIDGNWEIAIGSFFTGVAIAGGSNFLYDLGKKYLV